MERVFLVGDSKWLMNQLRGHRIPALQPYVTMLGIPGVTFEIRTTIDVREVVDLVGYAYRKGEVIPHYSCRDEPLLYGIVNAVPTDWQTKVTFEGSGGEHWKSSIQVLATALLQRLADRIQKPILVTVPHGSGSNPTQQAFGIHIWSTLERDTEETVRTVPHTIWGIDFGCRDMPYLPSGNGIAIMDPETNYCVAELFKNNLMVHHDLCHRSNMDELKILDKLIENVLKIIKKEVSVDTQDPAETTRQFLSLYTKAHDTALRDTRAKLRDSEVRIADYRAKLAEAEAEKAACKESERLLTESMPKTEQVQDILTRLRNHPTVEHLVVRHGVIVLKTKRLYARDAATNVVHRLGRQTITLHPDGKNGAVRFVCNEGNISGTGRAGPRCTKEGFITHPEALEGLTELVALRKYDEALDLALQAMSDVEPSTPKQRFSIAKWPHATPEELMGTEWEGQQVMAVA